ncbi:alpha-N-acetylgalactosaminidase-like isoform X1 [Onthophagus taurus]|uniref:alpha-N-acetylgalactosaminidase-like isoform X1 n=2 Tax=Onthophagus taurus TaxID=166361 RepID=UPI0039BE30E4
MILFDTLFLYLTLLINPVFNLDNGLALTPPMGFMTWQRFRCIVDCKSYPDECISENLIKRQAELMVQDGYLDAGYEYIIIDDCWSSKERDENGRLQADPERFPNGIPALADYVHNLGLKFGIYGDYGTLTCGGYPGSINYLEVDAETWAEWGVDYVKLDGCYSELEDMEAGYAEFANYLNKTGRPMVYSCSWPAYFEFGGYPVNFEILATTCNLWRNWADIQDSWSSLTTITKWFGDNQDRFSKFSAPGHWNDPDMLLIGNYGLTEDQSKSQMAIWSVMAAPLLMSLDLNTVKPEFKSILLNKDAIAINQDSLGIMGKRIYQKNDIEIWSKPILPIINGYYTYAVAFVSYRDDGHAYRVEEKLETLGLTSPNGYLVENIFEPNNVDLIDFENIWARINPSGTVFLRLTPIGSVLSN